MMPNHANGYSLKYCVLSDSGISWRQMLCEPSAPTRYSHRTSRAMPSPSTKEITGWSRTSPDPRVAHAEADVPAITLSRVGQVDEDVGLGIKPDGRAHEMLEVDPVALAPEAQLDPLVLGALGQDATVDAGLGEEPDAVLLQDARPMGVLDLVSTTGVDGDRVGAAL